MVEGVAYDAEALGEIAKIPSREELLSKLSEEDREALRLGRELQKKKAGAEPDVEIAGEIGITAEELYNDVIKKVAESVRLMKKSTWNSYDEMNKLLIEKVREVK